MRHLRASGIALTALVALFALPATGAAQTTIPGGNIINQTWTTAGSPYTVQGDITVPVGAFLTIEAGVEVRAATTDAVGSGADTGRVEIIINGAFTVSGTAAAPVLFRSTTTTIGSWYGIVIDSADTVSITGADVRRARYGVYATSGSPTIDASNLQQNTYGVWATGTSSASLTGSTLVSNTSTGAYVLNTADLGIDHCTVYGNSDGVFLSAGAVTISDSVITNNTDDGVDRNGGTAAISASTVWGNGTDFEGSVSTGAGVIRANPLYVSSSDLRLTENSPARFGGAAMSDQGALPYVSDPTPGLYGTLWTSRVVAAGSTTVAGDLTVAPGVTLTLEAGATLRFATSDIMRAHEDTGRSELRVFGQLVTEGTAASPVLLTSTTTTIGSWWGPHLYPGSTGNALAGLTVSRARYGIYGEAADPGTFDALTLTRNTYGVWVTGSGTVALTNSQLLSNTSTGGYVLNTGRLDLDHCTVHGNSDGVFISAGTLDVTNSVVTNNTDDGIDRNGGTASVSQSTVWGNGTNFEGSISTGAGVITANPLYVSAADLRLTENSPARFGSGDMSDQGALPYVSDPTPGLYGTLWTNRTVGAGSTTVAGDLTVAPGVTLTLEAGATLRFATSDIMRAYEDTGRSELRVFGSLVTEGTSVSPVTLTSTTTTIGSWWGPHLYEASSSNALEGLVVNRARYGIYSEATDPGLVNRVILSRNTYGIWATSSTSLTVQNCLLQSNTSTGAYVLNTAALDLRNCTVYGNSDGVFLSAGTATQKNCILTNNTDDGLDRNGGTASISYSDVWGNGTNFEGSVSMGAGMLSINPLFAGAPGDLRLTSTSTCLDAGDAAGAPLEDLEGATRPMDGDGIGGAAHDMGAYEFASMTVCGDGIIGAGELCDDGGLNGTYGHCNSGCTALGPRCGDMTLDAPPEECDDGNGNEMDACLSTCLDASCGDGFVRAGVESCDDGNMDDTDMCVGCLAASCGDGFVQVGVEACDDSNTDNTDDCVACADATCGDGFVWVGVEACDDGNGSDTDACTNACEDARCGDGIVGPGEACDDGNMDDGDACSNTCRDPSCGDGITQSGEECDDGNTVNDDECTNACRNPACGDGIIQMGEQCDDGNRVDGDACSNVCEDARCGDGILQVGEDCDDGNMDPADACTTECREARCGDGFVRAGLEVCDDGNDLNDDGCVEGCLPAECGDGFLRTGVEACDDGNTDGGDGCSPICALASCGDGAVQSGEECDDGNASNLDGCLDTCFSARCGDGFVRVGAEACDDGNDLDTDECLASCRNASCGDGFVWAGVEVCDDANADQTDACLLTCEEASCGDGFVQSGVEECDDGNLMAGDGCAPGCTEDMVTGPDGGVPDGGPMDGGPMDGAAPPADGGMTPTSSGGCGCVTAGAGGESGAGFALAALLGLGLAVRRRR